MCPENRIGFGMELQTRMHGDIPRDGIAVMSFWSKSSDADTAPKPGAAAAPPDQDTPSLKEARYQIEGVTDMFNRMNETCFDKCIGKMNDPELNIGELSCVDRCVLKYMLAQNQIGMKLRQETMQQQQQH